MAHSDAFTAANKYPGASLSDTERQIDMISLRSYRLGRIQQLMKELDYAGCVFSDPINIRYATGTRNCQVFALRHACRYVFVATEGPVVLFEMHGDHYVADGIEIVDQVRAAVNWSFTASGSRVDERARRWAEEIADLVRVHGGGIRQS